MYVHVPAAMVVDGDLRVHGGGELCRASCGGTRWPMLPRARRRRLARRSPALCLITGSLWGAPTWGTWWEWDGRMTSMLVLFVTYLGYIALWNAIEDEEKAGAAGGDPVPVRGDQSADHPISRWSGGGRCTRARASFAPTGPAFTARMLVPLLTMIARVLLLVRGADC